MTEGWIVKKGMRNTYLSDKTHLIKSFYVTNIIFICVKMPRAKNPNIRARLTLCRH